MVNRELILTRSEYLLLECPIVFFWRATYIQITILYPNRQTDRIYACICEGPCDRAHQASYAILWMFVIHSFNYFLYLYTPRYHLITFYVLYEHITSFFFCVCASRLASLSYFVLPMFNSHTQTIWITAR